MAIQSYVLTAEVRERAGKGVARALRREDKIPAVIYGGKKEPAPIAIPNHVMTLEYQKGGIMTKICEIEVAGKKELVLARDVQIHPVNDRVLHVDFRDYTIVTLVPSRAAASEAGDEGEEAEDGEEGETAEGEAAEGEDASA